MAASLIAFQYRCLRLWFWRSRSRTGVARGMVDQPGPRKYTWNNSILGGLPFTAACCWGFFRFSRESTGTNRGDPCGSDADCSRGNSRRRGWLHHQVKLLWGCRLRRVFCCGAEFTRKCSVFWWATDRECARRSVLVIWVVGITASFSILDHRTVCARELQPWHRVLCDAGLLERPDAGVSVAAAVLGAAADFCAGIQARKIFMVTAERCFSAS